MNHNQNFRNLYPLNTIDVTSFQIITNIYEGLISFSQNDLSIEPRLAEKWDVNKDGTEFVFHIRKGVYFHDDSCFPDGKGREVNAHDFKYCFDKLCEADPNNQGYWVFKNHVKGADEYFNATINYDKPIKGVSGITVLDDYTLKIELTQPFSGFLNMLGTPFTFVFPREAIEKYGAIGLNDICIGTGPFKTKYVKHGEIVILIRNENYWGKDEHGNQLPYLDAIKFTFIQEKKSEMIEFEKGNLDMVVPGELRDAIKQHAIDLTKGLTPFTLQITPALSVSYLRFQHLSPIFSNKFVRQAFNYAIDRQKIANFALKGEGQSAFKGIVPPAFKDYNSNNIKGYEYNPEKAKDLLAQAGYPDGRDFPEIILHLSPLEEIHHISGIIQNMIKENLNINIKIVIIPLAQLIENFESGGSIFWYSRWVADYPDPENFLNLLYGIHVPVDAKEKTHINADRYRNEVFDSIFALALKTVDQKKRYALYQQADQIALDDAAIIPLYYPDSYRLLKAYIKGFDINGMEYIDLRRVYFDKTGIPELTETSKN